MGCGGSTPADPLPSEVEVRAIEVPGGNGVVYPQMSVRAKIPLKYGAYGDFTGDMTDVKAQISSESTAGAGFRLVAFNYPTTPGWMDRKNGNAGVPLLLDVTRKGMLDASPDSFGMMVLQQVDVPASPLETKVVSSEMSFEISMQGHEVGCRSSKATGFEELYSKLKLLGDEGYSLAAVIDEPDKRMPERIVADSATASAVASAVVRSLATNPLKAQPVVNTVTLVGQRVAGAAPRATTYIVQDVPIETSEHTDPHTTITYNQHTSEHTDHDNRDQWGQGEVINATMPTLHATLKEHFGPKQCKLAAVYNPSIMDRDNVTPTTRKYVKACHLIFEPTDEPYAVCVVDTAIYIRLGKNEGVDYSSYISVIENFVAKGWELAAAINMPDRANKTGGSFFHPRWASTVKLVFQAKSNQPGLVTATAPPVPVS
jgi:hypothetical protein